MIFTSLFGLLTILLSTLLGLMPSLPDLPTEIMAVFTFVTEVIGQGFNFMSTIFGGDWFVSTLILSLVLPLFLFDPAYKIGLFIYKRVKS